IRKDDVLIEAANKEPLHDALLAYNQQHFKLADTLMNQLLRKYAEHPYLLYFAGKCKYEMGDYESALVLLKKAPEINSTYTGYANWKNKIIERVTSEEGICLLRTFDRFMDSAEHGLIGHNLIIDAHHPNLKGYCILQTELSNAVGITYHEKVKRVISLETLPRDFELDSDFYAGVYYRLAEWYMYRAFMTEEREIRLSKMKYYVNAYERLKPGEDIGILWGLAISILESDEKAFWIDISRLDNCKNKPLLLTRFHNAFKYNPEVSQKITAAVSGWHSINESQNKTLDELIVSIK
ncbi:MAG: hypothetical protein JWO06_3910, partial [Bacteroidota bacterium]|nr:hypothetical protein [Bacteroidota bacterium]